MSTEDDDGEFFDLFDGLDENVPGPSKAFEAELLDDLRSGFTEEAIAPVIALGEAPDAPLFDLDGPEATPVRPSWWMAAALAVIALLAAGMFALNGSNNDVEIVAADETETATTAGVAADDTTTSSALAASADVDFTTPLGFTTVETSELRAAFTSNQETVFNATIRRGSDVIETSSGTAVAGEAAEISFDRLEPSTLYSLEVTLIGPPAVVSPRIEIRTAGENTPIEIDGLTVVSQTATTAAVSFETNLCARASVVVLTAVDQREAERVAGDPEGPCSQDHLLTVGEETPLTAATDYIVLVDVVASSGEAADGTNVTSESISLRTEG